MRAILLFLFLTLNVAAEERWYVFSIGETPVGYVSEESDGTRTRTVLFAKLVRLGSSVEMRFETNAVESENGLQSLKFEQLLSKQPSGFEARVEGDRVRIGERVIDRGALPLLGPAAIARRTAETLRATGDALEYAILSPELQRIARVRRTVVATNERACNGEGATKIEESIEGYPAPRTLWTDANGIAIGDTIAGPFGPMRTCRSTREAALAANGELPADLYERTVARSNVRLADPASIDRIVVRVTPHEASQTMPDFTTHNQKMIAPNTVEIRRHGAKGTYAKEHLEPNALIESKNADIVKIATGIEGPNLPEALTKWVAENMKMDAGIVMAPASELIRDRKATCMGYATLLAALARARGIPSRIAMGYVYYGGIWGGHAWTEMWVDGQWLPYDAAVYAPGVASATRLAAGASSFADGGGDLNTALMMLFGRTSVTILEYEAAGRTTHVPPDQLAYRVEGTRYINPGLGLDVDAKGWTIENADSTWPSTLIVAFRKGNATIELREKR